MEIKENEWYFKTIYDKEKEEMFDTLPNYLALLYCIKHKATSDKGLKMMGIYPNDGASEYQIKQSSYVRKGREHKGLNRG